LISIFINYTIWLTFLCRIWVYIVQGFPSRAFEQRLIHSSASAKTIPVFQHQTAATNIPWTGGQRRTLERAKQSTRTCSPLLTLLLIQKIYHLNTLHLYPAKTNKVSKTNKERVTEFLYQAVELSTSTCSIFTENEGLLQIKSRRWSWLHTALAQITRIAPKCITLYWKFFHSSRFLRNLRLPWKNRVTLKIFTVVNILFTFRIFNNSRLPWKQSFPWNFSLYWIYFLLFRIFEQLALALKKTELPRKFSLYWI